MYRHFTIILTIPVLVSIASGAWAQDSEGTPPLYRHYKETSLTLGYNYNFYTQDKGVKDFHFLEVGVWKSNYTRGIIHPSTFAYYAASDFSLNTDKLVVGPKIGGFASVMMFGVGAELCYYTDFDDGSLRFIPSIGFFSPYFKLTINPHVPLTNKEFYSLNKLTANLTIRVLPIKRVEKAN